MTLLFCICWRFRYVSYILIIFIQIRESDRKIKLFDNLLYYMCTIEEKVNIILMLRHLIYVLINHIRLCFAVGCRRHDKKYIKALSHRFIALIIVSMYNQHSVLYVGRMRKVVSSAQIFSSNRCFLVATRSHISTLPSTGHWAISSFYTSFMTSACTYPLSTTAS